MMRFLIPALVFLVAVVGCGGNEMANKVVGNWVADMSKSNVGGSSYSKRDLDLVKDYLQRTALRLKADGTFEMQFMMALQGTWTVEGNKLILTPTGEGSSMTFAGGKKTMDFDIDPSVTSMTFAAEVPGMNGKLVLAKLPE